MVSQPGVDLRHPGDQCMHPHDSGLRSIRAGLAILAAACFISFGNAQPTPTGNTTFPGNNPSDPGPRGGPAAAGAPGAGLSNIATLYAAFNGAAANFQEVEDVAHNGLGPRFNSNSCVSCHIQPATGGSSPASNPQVQFANSQNRLPFFIQPNGPVREARFIVKPDGTPDGGGQALFTIGGRPDQPSGCNLLQEDLSHQSNIIFRIPTPAFGLRLSEAIPDSNLVRN